MPTKSKTTKRRTTVKDIPQAAKALSKGQQKKVKGGFTGGVFVAAGDVNRVATGDVTGDGKAEIIKRSAPGSS